MRRCGELQTTWSLELHAVNCTVSAFWPSQIQVRFPQPHGHPYRQSLGFPCRESEHVDMKFGVLTVDVQGPHIRRPWRLISDGDKGLFLECTVACLSPWPGLWRR